MERVIVVQDTRLSSAVKCKPNIEESLRVMFSVLETAGAGDGLPQQEEADVQWNIAGLSHSGNVVEIADIAAVSYVLIFAFFFPWTTRTFHYSQNAAFVEDAAT